MVSLWIWRESESPCTKKIVASAAETIAPATMIVCLAMKVWAFIPLSFYGNIARWVLQLTGTIAAIFGLFGLIKASLSDRRWRSLYVIGLTILIECVLVLALLASMSLDSSSFYWWVPYVANLGMVGGIGLIGVGHPYTKKRSH